MSTSGALHQCARRSITVSFAQWGLAMNLPFVKAKDNDKPLHTAEDLPYN